MPNDDLDSNAKDRGLAVARATLASIPIVGPSLLELLSVTIPNQRQDRIVAYLRAIENKVEAILSKDETGRRLTDEASSLIEDGGLQASLSTTDARIEYIASLVRKGLDRNDLEIIRQKRLLKKLGELDDEEILLLAIIAGISIPNNTFDVKLDSYTLSFSEGIMDSMTGGPNPAEEERNKHQEMMLEALRQEELKKAGRNNLITLGLATKQARQSNNGHNETTPRNNLKPSAIITPLGELLLTEIGLLTDKLSD